MKFELQLQGMVPGMIDLDDDGEDGDDHYEDEFDEGAVEADFNEDADH